MIREQRLDVVKIPEKKSMKTMRSFDSQGYI